MGAIAVAQITIYDVSDIAVSAVAPLDPPVDQMWLDTQVEPNQMKRWNGEEWEIVNDQADLANAIQDVQNQVDDMCVGGKNLLNNTSDQPVTITENTTLQVLDLADYSDGWNGWVTYRAKLSPTSGTWKLRLKITAKEEASGSLGSLIIGRGVYNVVEGDVVYIDSEEYTSEAWATVTTKMPSADFIVEPQIILVSSTGSVDYSYAQFELGNMPTQWAPSTEDIHEEISDVETQLSIDIQAVRASTGALIETMSNDLTSAINMRVTKTEYNARDQEIRSSISSLNLANENITADVSRHDALLGDLGTHVVIDAQNGLILRQDQNANYEAVLASDTLSFKQTGSGGAVMASFGVSGGYVDRLRSNKTLSVGSEKLGWYDMTQLSGGGVADKWRNGTDDVQVCVIKEQPVNYYGTSSASFTVIAEDATDYQWEHREKPEDDAWSNAPNSSTSNTYTVALSTAIQYEYRCKVSNGRSTVYSRTVRAFDTSGPVILCDIPEKAQPLSTIQVFAAGQPTYQWQTKTGSNSWQNAGTGSSITVSQNYDYYRCILTANGHSAYTRVCKVDSAS